MPVLHIIDDTDVWLDTDGDFMDGTVIGVGRDRQSAVADAVQELEQLIQILQSPSTEWKRTMKRGCYVETYKATK